MPNTHWIVVADATRARIFESGALFDNLKELTDLTHPESRAHETDLVSDGQGNTRQFGGGPSAHYSPQTSKKDHEKEVFAKELAAHLEQGLNDHRYEKLVVAAPAKFHSLLLKALPKRVTDAIDLKVDRDYTRLKPHDIPAALKKHVH